MSMETTVDNDKLIKAVEGSTGVLESLYAVVESEPAKELIVLQIYLNNSALEKADEQDNESAISG